MGLSCSALLVSKVVQVVPSAPECCSICLEDLDQHVTTRCGHMFHEACLAEWTSKNKTCPLCRSRIPRPRSRRRSRRRTRRSLDRDFQAAMMLHETQILARRMQQLYEDGFRHY
jgi:hypothetical protein